MNWQVTEIFIGCLLIAIFLGILLIAAQCLSSCYHDWRSNRLKTDAERLPDDYVNEIRQLLDRHKKIMNEYDFPDDHTEEESMRIEDTLEKAQSEVGSSNIIQPYNNSVKVEKLREEYNDSQLCQKDLGISLYKKLEGTKRRRSWDGLIEYISNPAEMPSSLDVSVQTTSTIDRTYASVKIETTV